MSLPSSPHLRLIGLLLIALMLSAGCWVSRAAPPRPAPSRDLRRVERWWILIGHAANLGAIDWRRRAHATDMVIVSDDPRIRLTDLPPETLRLGYVSVGEADAQRPYWRTLEGCGCVVEPNPNWAAGYRVDVRAPRWQRALLEDEIPRLMARGIDGLMLDTLDTAPYLERKDPARFAGSLEALRHLLAQIRRAYPTAVLLANGSDALVEAAPFVDGYVTEGVFATYDFERRAYRQSTDDEQAWKLAQIERARAVAERPVFTIEYAGLGDIELAEWASNQSWRRGFRPYVTVKDVNELP